MFYLNWFKIKGTDLRQDPSIQHVTTGIQFACNKNENILIFIFNKNDAKGIKGNLARFIGPTIYLKTIKNELWSARIYNSQWVM